MSRHIFSIFINSFNVFKQVDSFLQNRNLQETIWQFYLTDHGSIPLESNLISNIQWLELPAGAPLDGFWFLEDCSNHKPFPISARFCCQSSWDFFNFLLLHPTSSSAPPFYLHPFTLYFYMQIYGKDHYMPQLELRDVIRIEIKNHGVLLPKTLWELFMVTRYYWLFTLWWTKVPKEIIFSAIFLMAPVSLNINF